MICPLLASPFDSSLVERILKKKGGDRGVATDNLEFKHLSACRIAGGYGLKHAMLL